MFSVDGSGLPLWLIGLLLVLGVLCYLGTGIFTEMTWRNATLKDLEIIRRLREGETNRKAYVAAIIEGYEKKVLKRVDAHLNGRTAAALTLGIIIRAVPAFAFTMTIWPLYMFYEWHQGLWQFSWIGLAQSLFTWVLGGLMVEGLFSVLRPFIRPLSQRWDTTTVGGEPGGMSDARDAASGKKDQ